MNECESSITYCFENNDWIYQKNYSRINSKEVAQPTDTGMGFYHSFFSPLTPPLPHHNILLFPVFSRRPIRINMYTYIIHLLHCTTTNQKYTHYTLCSGIMFKKRSQSPELQMISIDQIFIIHVYVVFLNIIHFICIFSLTVRCIYL